MWAMEWRRHITGHGAWPPSVIATVTFSFCTRKAKREVELGRKKQETDREPFMREDRTHVRMR